MNKNSFLKNASWIMVGRLIQLMLTFVTTMLVTRYLGPAEYGKLTYIFSYIQFFIPVCTAGMNDIVVKKLIDNEKRNDEIMGTILGIRLFFSLVSVICSIGIVAAFNNESIFVNIALLQSLSLVFQSFDTIMYFYQSKMLAHKSGLIYALAYIISSLFRIALIVLKKDIRWFAFAMSFDYIVLATMLIVLYFSDNNRLFFSFDMAKDLLKSSKHYAFASIMVVLYGKVTDILFLGKIVNETAVGYYGAVSTLCNAWPFVLIAIIDSANPMIISSFNSDRNSFNRRIKMLYASVFYISVFVAIFVCLFSDIIIKIVYGTDFLPGSTAMKIYSWSIVFAYIGVARTAWIQCYQKTKYETVISLIGAIVSIISNYYLIHWFGINGAAISALITQFITNFAIQYIIKDTRENARLIVDAIFLKGVFDKSNEI